MAAERPEIAWRIVQVKPAAEKRVEEALREEHKLDTYLVMERAWVGIGQRRRTIERPFIRGYVFARFGNDFCAMLRDIDGFSRVIMYGPEELAILPDKFVTDLMMDEAEGLFDSTKPTPSSRKPPKATKGAKVRVTDGHYAGHYGYLMKLKGSARARVMLALTEKPIEIGLDKLEDAEDLKEAA